jgi:hypothetical protein
LAGGNWRKRYVQTVLAPPSKGGACARSCNAVCARHQLSLLVAVPALPTRRQLQGAAVVFV